MEGGKKRAAKAVTEENPYCGSLDKNSLIMLDPPFTHSTYLK